MESLLTPSNIMFVIGILGVIFGVFNYFRNPQEALDKRQAVDQTEVDGKAKLLAQQVQWEKESNEKRFGDIANRLTEAMTLAENHIHTVDTKVEALGANVNAMSREVVRLSTIIEERIPKGALSPVPQLVQ